AVPLLLVVIVSLLSADLFRAGIEVAVSLLLLSFTITALYHGGMACIRHVALRVALWDAGVAPWNYAALLNDASDLLLMRRVGGGFAFWHLQLRDFLAGLSKKELRRLIDEA
ncbi:MAG: hypothetical protein RMJ55_19885, partial [Roseiflexaceae bacterium]|nr:hypothetical protein [Roseiflexaceae bacterium]